MSERTPMPAAGADPAATSPNGADAALLERVRALLPRIAEAAPRIDQERRIPEPLLTQIMEAGLYRMCVPRQFGGDQVHPLTMMQAVEMIAGAEASTAWNLCQNAVCGSMGAYLDPPVARELFGHTRAVLAWGPPSGPCRAVQVPGGYRVTGRWSFASGMRHADLLGAHAPVLTAEGQPVRDRNGAPLFRTMLVPATACTLVDEWHVIGLRGTASDSFTVNDVFVPASHSVIRDDPEERRDHSPHYCFKTTNLYGCGFGCIALGVARAMLDAFIQLATEKIPRAQKHPLRENAAVQSQVGQAEAQLRAARAFLRDTVAEVWKVLVHTRQLTLDQRISIRMAATHAIHQARQVGEMAYEAAGATAIFAGNPFEKRFRDLHTIAQQTQGRRAHFESVGKFLLGLEPETMFL